MTKNSYLSFFLEGDGCSRNGDKHKKIVPEVCQTCQGSLVSHGLDLRISEGMTRTNCDLSDKSHRDDTCHHSCLFSTQSFPVPPIIRMSRKKARKQKTASEKFVVSKSGKRKEVGFRNEEKNDDNHLLHYFSFHKLPPHNSSSGTSFLESSF